MAAVLRDSRRGHSPVLRTAMQTVTSDDGTRIAYERHGDGPPLVLLHGDATGAFWEPIVPRFTDDYSVVVPDRRGRGASDDYDEHGLEREVEDVLAVLEDVDGEPTVFGHSFGGLQALEAARRTSVTVVVAYEPAILVGEYRATADLADRMEALLADGEREAAVRLHLREVMFGGDEDADLDAWLGEWPLWPQYVEWAEQTLRMDRAVERYELPNRLDVSAPGLVLTGTDGPSHLRDSARAVADALPDGRLVEFDGVSHAGPVEAPERVTAAVREFLVENTGSAASAE